MSLFFLAKITVDTPYAVLLFVFDAYELTCSDQQRGQFAVRVSGGRSATERNAVVERLRQRTARRVSELHRR